MSKSLKIHLFNCDRTYKLDAVEDWLNGAKLKLGSGFEFSVEKQYFSLAEMSEWSSSTIPGLQMDLAVFVVHAHESRLSINEVNAGIGYAKIYSALLQATEGNVIIVIGGDDNYKNEDEEDREVISRWAKRKVSSQFSEEFLDGRESFIFSWNKKHREVHEDALVHFFGKKGQKFEYQPKRKLPPRPTTPPPARAAERVQPSKLNRSLSECPSTGERELSADTRVAGRNREPHISEQGIKAKEFPPSGATRDLAILGCHVSDRSMEVVKRVFNDLRPALNISSEPILSKVSPLEANSYLTENPPRFCVLVVDADTVQDAYERLPERRVEYEDLLRTAADRVIKKVIVMICGPCALPSANDEAIFTGIVESILTSSGKGFVVELINNRIAVEPGVLLQMILGQTSYTVNTQPQLSHSSGFSRSSRQSVQQQQGGHITSSPSQETVYDPLRYNQNVYQSQQAVPIESTVLSSAAGWVPHKGEAVVLKARLCNGRISGHVEISRPGFKVPKYIEESLSQAHFNTPEAVVKIISDEKGKLRWSVELKSKSKTSRQGILPSATEDEKSLHLAENETEMLKTRVRYGKISLEKDDLQHLHQGWSIPKYLTDTLKRECCSIPDGELHVISDETGKLRYKVLIGKKEKFLGVFSKAGKIIKNTFS